MKKLFKTILCEFVAPFIVLSAVMAPFAGCMAYLLFA